MYQFDSRVRYSETDEQGRLSVTGILNYLQDCSTLQSEDIGLGIEYLKNIVERVGFMDGKIISGVSYAGWGCVPRNDLTGNKEPIVERSVDSMKKIVKTAEDY